MLRQVQRISGYGSRCLGLRGLVGQQVNMKLGGRLSSQLNLSKREHSELVGGNGKEVIETDNRTIEESTKEEGLETTDQVITEEETVIPVSDPDWYVDELTPTDTTTDTQTELPRWMLASKLAPTSTIQPGPLTVELLEAFLRDQNSQEVVTIDVREKCDWTDFMTIAQGRSLRHLQAMSDSAQIFVKQCKAFDSELPDAISLEGATNDEWIVLDAGNHVIHFMTESSKNLYQLEDLWSQGPEKLFQRTLVVENH